MRLIVIFLASVGALLLVLAAFLPTRPAGQVPGSVEVPGTVTGLADGPYHARVRFTSTQGEITFPANVEAGLAAGQRVIVRYVPGQALATAEVVAPAGQAVRGARMLLWLGMAFLLAAAASPLLVRAFPDLLAFRLRP